MAIYDSIINNDNFVSDYFMTSEDSKGTFYGETKKRIAYWKKEPGAEIHKRLASMVTPFLTEFAQFNDEGHDQSILYTLLHNFMGFPEDRVIQHDLATDGDACKEFLLKGYLASGNHTLYLDATAVDAYEDIVNAKPLTPVVVDGKPQEWNISKTLSQVFALDTPPEYAVVIAGQWLLFTSREAWPYGRYLAVNIRWVCEQNETKTGGLNDLATCIFVIENTSKHLDGSCWWDSVLEAAKEHTAKVSGSLRHAVRDCVQILGNDVLQRRTAQGLENTDEIAEELTREALRYMYRILFILFAEASPELGVLPVGTDEYDMGYGLTRLTNQVLERPNNYAANNGTYLYQSLEVLFENVNGGSDVSTEFAEYYMSFAGVEADIFLPENTKYISEVGLSNSALQKILNKLLLTPKPGDKSARGKKSGRGTGRTSKSTERGFISYASLGVTELGQVYEGLMSYKGFIAEESLYEVAPGGDNSQGSWMIPCRIADADEKRYPKTDIVGSIDPETGEFMPVYYPQGSFVYRQSSYDRERSASFYTPEVLTSFVVDQALEVLEEQGAISKAEDYLHLSVCEPAMGSGAFAVQAVRKLADRYLTMREEELRKELGSKYEALDPEDRPEELQKVKAYIALRNVYGVDLNNTAVELGQIALWLDAMVKGLRAPWFGLHLRAGNSLIGASRTTFNAKDLAKDASKKKPDFRWLDTPADKYAANEDFAGKVYSFLLPSPTWGAATSKVETHVKKRFGDEIKNLNAWSKSISKPDLLAATPFEVNRQFTVKTATDSSKHVASGITRLEFLEQLSLRINQLWEFATVRLQLAEKQIERDFNIRGYKPDTVDRQANRQMIEASLDDANSALQRLKLVMDAWCALKFWSIITPHDNNGNKIVPPSYDEWLQTIDLIVGEYVPETQGKNGQISFGTITTWNTLEEAERDNAAFAFAGRGQDVEKIVADTPWLQVVRKLASEQNFFHWELMFAQVFANGGFDLVIGNPPWVRPQTDEQAALAEFDPWWVIAKKSTQAEQNSAREEALANQDFLPSYVNALTIPVVTSKILNDPTLYPELLGQKADLYRAFMVRSWDIVNSATGTAGLIHPESHFTEEKAAPLRKEAYHRLQRHFQFINELKLFDVHNLVTYGCHIYSSYDIEPRFINMVSLYHPLTAVESLRIKTFDGSVELPGTKTSDGNWDLRPHPERKQLVGDETLALWCRAVETEGTPIDEARMVYAINITATNILAKLAVQPKIKELGLLYHTGWNETTDRKKGYFEHGYNTPITWDEVILQGPHIGVATPCIKQPNPTLKSNKDWSETNFLNVTSDFVPACAYIPSLESGYEESYRHIKLDNGDTVSHKDFYRIGWREMAANTGFRTLYPAILPPRAAHGFTIMSAFPRSLSLAVLLTAAGSMSSIITDYYLRSLGGGHLQGGVVDSLPLASNQSLVVLAAKLNCITAVYADLYKEASGEEWTWDSPLRHELDRQKALAEIDVIVAKDFGLTLDELIYLYTKQFPIMARYDNEWMYDANGDRTEEDGEVFDRVAYYKELWATR
ncbi:MAG: class I SAM-dependent DNA methyltransferase [Corynebacterium sp.]|nr:class I SAM-dependent DNA methyltransferase [Corynebacterium sp.]